MTSQSRLSPSTWSRFKDESKDFVTIEIPAGIHENIQDTDSLAVQGKGVRNPSG